MYAENESTDVYRENIRNLIRRPETPVIKPPLHRSVYADSVKRQYMKVKDCHRTMGLANVCLNPPSQYLKKGSKTINMKPCVDKIKPSTKKPIEMPPVQKSPCPKICKNKTPKNLVQMNIIDVKRQVPPLPKHRVQDTRNGHVMVLDKDGLEPTYVMKKDFGKTPAYILKIKKEKELARQKEEERKRAIKPPLRRLPDSERNELLKGLKTNWAELNRRFLVFPMVIDTDSKRRRKFDLEKRLTALEKDIDLLERKTAIYVCQDA